MGDAELYYGSGQRFPGTIMTTADRSRPAYPRPPVPPPGAPSFVVIVLDDVGFGQIGAFGGLGGRVRTPHIDRLADAGLRYNNFHVSPMCSPTRAALLTGRNNHSVGVGTIMELTTGFPGYNGRIPKEAAMLPAILAEHGYASAAFGKWHLTPGDEMTPIGPFDRWPLGQGFQRFYGFLGALTDQWHPILFADNHYVGVGGETGEPYHVSEDIVDHAIAWCRDHDAVAPGRPYFLYVAFGALHQPHQVSAEWIEPYRGVFADGWDVIREETLEHQKALGIVPADTVLPERNHGVPEWRDLDGPTRRLLERQMEVAAGFLSHTDHQVGRLLDELERHDRLDDAFVAVLSDNGACAEGGPYGQFSPTRYFNGAEESVEENLARIDDWGGPESSPIYASGWAMAGNTPNRWYKEFTYEGGTRAPLVVRWPRGIEARGEIRSQFHAAVDVVPTLLEVAGIEMPRVVGGVTQRPLEGVSFAYSLADAGAPTRKTVQYFEMWGHRAIWANGWKAVCAHWTNHNQYHFLGTVEQDLPFGDLGRDEWELFDLDADYAEARNLAAVYPEHLASLISLWWAEAGRYQVLPIDDYTGSQVGQRASLLPMQRDVYRYVGPMELTPFSSPRLRRRPHSFRVRLERAEGDDGVLVSEGGPEGGYCLCVVDGQLLFVMNYFGEQVGIVEGGMIPTGRCEVTARLRPRGDDVLEVLLSPAGGAKQDPATVRANPVRYDMRGRGLRVGADPVGVWKRYTPPFRFPGAIEEVLITCEGPDSRDLAAELEIARAEQ